MNKARVFFLITENVHALDLAGPLQVFYEAKMMGIPYEIIYLSRKPDQKLSAQLSISELQDFREIDPNEKDIIIIPGFEIDSFNKTEDQALFYWLQNASFKQVTICSICTGSFALAAAGLLDNADCTTHWRYIDTLQNQFPHLNVIKDKLYVQHNNIYTSAGVTTGIDLALHLIEQRHGAETTYNIAREIVVYTRRNGNEEQQSIFLQYRHHINSQVHIIQDWLLQNTGTKSSLEQMARIIHTSPRNLTRLFKAATGITIGEYREKLRVETARQLLKASNKMTVVARKTGFKTAIQLRAALKRNSPKGQ